jgi:hypothetical protein
LVVCCWCCCCCCCCLLRLLLRCCSAVYYFEDSCLISQALFACRTPTSTAVCCTERVTRTRSLPSDWSTTWR